MPQDPEKTREELQAELALGTTRTRVHTLAVLEQIPTLDMEARLEHCGVEITEGWVKITDVLASSYLDPVQEWTHPGSDECRRCGGILEVVVDGNLIACPACQEAEA